MKKLIESIRSKFKQINPENIKNFVEGMASVCIFVLTIFSVIGLYQESKYRNYKDVKITMDASLKNEINTIDDLKKLIEDGQPYISLKLSFTNNTKYALTAKNIKIEIIDAGKSEDEFYVERSIRPVMHDRDENGEEQNRASRIMTIPAGSAKEVFLVDYGRELTDEEKDRLLQIETDEELQQNRSAVYRILASCIEEHFLDCTWNYRVLFDEHCRAGDKSETKEALYNVKFNPDYGTLPISKEVIDSCFYVESLENIHKEYHSLTKKVKNNNQAGYDAVWDVLQKEYSNLQRSDDADSLARMYGLMYYSDSTDADKKAELIEYTNITPGNLYSIELDGTIYENEQGYESLPYDDIRKLMMEEIGKGPINSSLENVSESRPMGISIYKIKSGKYVLTFAFM